MAKSKLLAIFLCMLLSACETIPEGSSVSVEQVLVPITQACQTEEPDKPKFQFSALEISDDLERKVRVLLHDRLLHIAYENELRTALGACK